VGDIIAGLIGIGFFILWLYCIFDAITTDSAIIRHLPKVVWVMIVILLGDIGSILWLALGRPRVWARRSQERQRSSGTLDTRGRVVAPPPAERSLDRLDPIVRYREEQARLRLDEARRQRREAELGPGTDTTRSAVPPEPGTDTPSG